MKNICSGGELGESTTTEDYSVVQIEGRRRVRRTLKHCNLDAVISVGYRVHSKRGMRFRQWAARILRDHSAPAGKDLMIRLVVNPLGAPSE